VKTQLTNNLGKGDTSTQIGGKEDEGRAEAKKEAKETLGV